MTTYSILSHLDELQGAQLRHDVAAHQDILHLLVPKRLTHFTLHFAKYAGAFARASRTKDTDLFKKTITDTLIIVLAAANAMNVNLKQRASASQRSSQNASDLFSEYAETVGNMAKACEVLDHLENFPSRQVLEESVCSLCSLTDRWARLEHVDLLQAVTARWKQIEGKLAQPEVQRPRRLHVAA